MKKVQKLEKIRIYASHKMGLGDPMGSVVPKFCIISKARHDGSVNARYMVPHQCHATFPLVGGQCLAAASLQKGTIAAEITRVSEDKTQTIAIEHPVGMLETVIDYAGSRDAPEIKRIGFVRTARKLMVGEVYVPESTWPERAQT